MPQAWRSVLLAFCILSAGCGSSEKPSPPTKKGPPPKKIQRSSRPLPAPVKGTLTWGFDSNKSFSYGFQQHAIVKTGTTDFDLKMDLDVRSTGKVIVESQGTGLASVRVDGEGGQLRSGRGGASRDIPKSSKTHEGFRSDGTFSSGGGGVFSSFDTQNILGQLFGLPPGNLQVGKSVTVPASFQTPVMFQRIPVPSTRVIRYRGNAKRDGRNCAKLEVTIHFESPQLPDKVFGNLECKGSGKATVYFDLEDRCIHTATGKVSLITILDGHIESKSTMTETRNGVTKTKTSVDEMPVQSYQEFVSSITLTREGAKVSTETSPGVPAPSGPSAAKKRATFEKAIVAAIAKGKGIPHSATGTDRSGMSSPFYIHWTYGLVGKTIPKDLKSIAAAGKRIDNLRKLRPGDVMVFRSKKSPAPVLVALYAGKKMLAYIHPKKTWRMAKADNKFFIKYFLYGRRLVP